MIMGMEAIERKTSFLEPLLLLIPLAALSASNAGQLVVTFLSANFLPFSLPVSLSLSIYLSFSLALSCFLFSLSHFLAVSLLVDLGTTLSTEHSFHH